MRVAQIRRMDVANGPGIRVSLFLSGCHFNCYNCFNKEYQDFAYGEEFTRDHFDQIVKELQDPRVKGLSILGGEPLESAEALKYLIASLRVEMREDQDIWLWTGYQVDDIVGDFTVIEEIDKYAVILQVDTVVDGLFIQAKKDLSLQFRGSSNQRIIDMNETVKQRQVVEDTNYKSA